GGRAVGPLGAGLPREGRDRARVGGQGTAPASTRELRPARRAAAPRPARVAERRRDRRGAPVRDRSAANGVLTNAGLAPQNAPTRRRVPGRAREAGRDRGDRPDGPPLLRLRQAEGLVVFPDRG